MVEDSYVHSTTLTEIHQRKQKDPKGKETHFKLSKSLPQIKIRKNICQTNKIKFSEIREHVRVDIISSEVSLNGSTIILKEQTD